MIAGLLRDLKTKKNVTVKNCFNRNMSQLLPMETGLLIGDWLNPKWQDTSGFIRRRLLLPTRLAFELRCTEEKVIPLGYVRVPWGTSRMLSLTTSLLHRGSFSKGEKGEKTRKIKNGGGSAADDPTALSFSSSRAPCEERGSLQ